MTTGAALRRAGAGIACVVGVAAAGYAVGQGIRGRGVAVPSAALSLTLVLPALWLAVVWHELGHVAGGWAAGFRLRLLAAGPLRIDRRGEGFRWSFNRSLGLWGGFAATSPDSQRVPTEDALFGKLLLVVAGGPLASLAGGLLALAAGRVPAAPPRAALAILVFAATSATIGVLTLVPVAVGGFVNDGRRLIDLWRRTAAGRRWLANVTLSALAQQARPREWPAALVAAATDEAAPDYDGILARWLRYQWHLDRGEIDLAREWLGRALAGVDSLPASVQPIVHVAAADFYGRVEPDAIRARRHFDRATPAGFLSRDALAMAEAAVRLAEGDCEGARASARQARRTLDALAGSSRDQAAEMLGEIERRAGAG